MKPESCPCGSSQPYDACCGRWHEGGLAPTAEALMRSRYSAFVVGNAPYLMKTWHASTRPAEVSFEPKLKWLGLKVVDALAIDSDHAQVEFIARYRVGGASAGRHHERSRFVREQGAWFYVDGEQVAAAGKSSR